MEEGRPFFRRYQLHSFDAINAKNRETSKLKYAMMHIGT
jgi:hypothetical protein